MPVSTALPPAQPSFLQRIWGPIQDQWTTSGIDQNAGSLANCSLVWPTRMLGLNIATIDVFKGYSAGVSESRFDRYLGRFNMRQTAGGVNARGELANIPAGFVDYVYDGSGSIGGSRVNAEAVVMVWDWHLANSFAAIAAPTGPDDQTGVMWCGTGATDPIANISGMTPLAAAVNTGGFGIFANDAGGGLFNWEFVSWLNGAVLQRRTAAADPTQWSTFRFVLRTATPGSATPGRLQVLENGVELFSGLFDDTDLPTLETIGANAAGFVPGFNVTQLGTAGATGLCLQWDVWQGRFLPDGTELQSP